MSDAPICGIYGIKNTVNGKWYIGQSVDIKRRWRGEKHRLRNKCMQNDHFQSAWHLYGEQAFEFHVLEVVPDELLDAREASWIAFYNSTDKDLGYNCDLGGHKNKRLSEAHRAKFREAWKTRPPMTEATRQKFRDQYNNKTEAEKTKWKEAIRASRLGKGHSKETKEKMSAICKQRYKNPEYMAKWRKSCIEKGRFK